MPIFTARRIALGVAGVAIAAAVVMQRIDASTQAKLARARARVAGVSMAGRNAIVVGGTAGIGRGLALRLAAAGASVTVVGRSAARGAEVIAEMQEAARAARRGSGGGAGGGADGSGAEDGPAFAFMACDASRLRNVAATASAWRAAHAGQSLDALVLSTGIATIQGRTLTPEGLDVKMSLHYYSRMAWVKALLSELQASSDGRVLSVLAAGVHPAYEGWRDDPELERSYTLANVANAATFYNDLATDALGRAHPRLTFVHAMPGFVNTNWGTEMPAPIRLLVRMLQPLGRRATDAAEFLGLAVLDPRYAHAGGVLLTEYGEPAPRTAGHSDEAREAVWAHTEAVLARVLGGDGDGEGAGGAGSDAGAAGR